MVFESTREAEQFYGLLMRYWNQINRTFASGDFHLPYLLEDEDGKIHGNDWAKGFLAADPMGFKKLERDLSAILRKMPSECRPRACQVIGAFFKAMKPLRPTLQ